MKALTKKKPEHAQDGHLRHGYPYLQLGPLGSKNDQDPAGHRPRICRRRGEDRQQRSRCGAGRAGQRRRTYRLRALQELLGRTQASLHGLSIPVSNVWHCAEGIPTDVLACFDPFGNAVHTTLSYNLVGEDVLITGAGPIGCMAVAVAKSAGARYVVITDVNPYRLELARKMGPTLTLDARTQPVADAVKKLDMKEGFDVGLEMSGNPEAFKDMLANMCHGGKIALLGIMPETAIDWDYVVFNSLTIKGIYGREMFETWYKATMLIQGGVDLRPLITHRFGCAEYAKGFEVMKSGNSGKVILDWTQEP
jgi:threonine 3-dehydrogenase